jgi:hypothetical protein
MTPGCRDSMVLNYDSRLINMEYDDSKLLAGVQHLQSAEHEAQRLQSYNDSRGLSWGSATLGC